MPEYRAYRIVDGKVDIAAKVITARGDDAAIELTKSMVNGHDMELWEGPRFVWASSPKAQNRENVKWPIFDLENYAKSPALLADAASRRIPKTRR
jgi:hypothetical protein